MQQYGDLEIIWLEILSLLVTSVVSLRQGWVIDQLNLVIIEKIQSYYSKFILSLNFGIEQIQSQNKFNF